MRRRLSPPLEEGEGEEPLINLTPLIDVVFVVLITFMLIAPILNIDFVELATGGNTTQKEASAHPLTISIRSDNSIWLQGKKTSLSDLESTLRREKIVHPHQIPLVTPDKNAHFGTYQTVKNLLESCGYEQMDILLQPE